MSTLGTLRILRAEVHIPQAGAWFATCALDSSSLPPLGATVLSIGDLVLVGAILRANFDDHPGGALVTATARGGAGWRLPVAQAGSYASEGGVRLSTVLQDVAAMAAELYVSPPDTSLGTAYAWQASAPMAPVHYADVLAELVWRGYLPTWRVEPFTGFTRFDGWPAIGAADGRGRVMGRNLARGRRSVGLDVQVAAFLPGATLEGVPISRTVIYERASELRVEVYSTTDGASATGAATVAPAAVAVPSVTIVSGGGGGGLG